MLMRNDSEPTTARAGTVRLVVLNEVCWRMRSGQVVNYSGKIPACLIVLPQLSYSLS